MQYSKLPAEVEEKLKQQIIFRLTTEYGGIQKSQFVQQIICLKCQRKDAYTNAIKPFRIYCNHKNTCSSEGISYKEYFPGLYDRFWEQLKIPEVAGSHGTARFYATVTRGIWNFERWGGEFGTYNLAGTTYHALKFRLQDGKTCNYRLINAPEKSRNTGSTKGLLWLPETELDFAKPIFLAESPIKAMALLEAEHQAISTVSAASNPDDYSWIKENSKNIAKLILAFDQDKAGEAATLSWAKFCNQQKISFSAAFPIDGDWDDMLKAEKLTDKKLKKSLLMGALFLAESSKAAGLLLQEFYGICPSLFTWQNQTWKAIYEKQKSNDGETINVLVGAKLIMDAMACCSHNFFTKSGERKKEKTYIFRIANPQGKVDEIDFSGEDISTVKNFNKALLKNYGASYSGSDEDLTYLLRELIKIQAQPEILQYDRYGYHPGTEAYIFAHFAVDKNGKIHKINDKGYFPQIALAPMGKDQGSKHIANLQPIPISQILHSLELAYGANGLLALGYYVACYFSTSKIFPEYGFFPFLSLTGAKNRGKSTLAKFLNCAFLMEDREGYVQKKSSTAKSYNRILSRVDSLPVVLLEGNDANNVGVEENDLLSMYNREALQSRANKTQDNTINELRFDGGLVTVQNIEWFTQGAVIQRFVSLHFEDKSGTFSESERDGYAQLRALTNEQKASVGLGILADRAFYEENLLKDIKECSKELALRGVSIDRIRDNYAIVLGSLRALLTRHFKAEDVNLQFSILYNITTELATTKADSAEDEVANVEYFIDAFISLSKRMSGGIDSPLRQGEHFIFDGNRVHIRLLETLKVIGANGYGGIFDLKVVGPQLEKHPRFSARKSRSRMLTWSDGSNQARVYTIFKDAILPQIHDKNCLPSS